METGSTRRRTAILAADVVGYSRMMGEDETRTLSALRGLRSEVSAPAAAGHRGAIVKGLGDGRRAAFDSAAGEPRAIWWPSLFIALAALRRGRDEAARRAAADALGVFGNPPSPPSRRSGAGRRGGKAGAQ